MDRLDEIIIFNALSLESLRKILRSTIKKIIQRVESLGIALRIANEIININSWKPDPFDKT